MLLHTWLEYILEPKKLILERERQFVGSAKEVASNEIKNSKQHKIQLFDLGFNLFLFQNLVLFFFYDLLQLLRAESKKMRAVVQRVASASVEVEGRTVSSIGPGLLVLVGLHDSDADSDAEYICRKVLNMRLFPNDKTARTWDQNVMQRNYEILIVSQFTLYGILKGNKPDFHVAMSPDRAKPFYTSLVERFQKAYKSDAVKDGIFGAMMKVNLVNDGPVTMQLDSSQPTRNTKTIDAAEAS